MLYYGFNNSSSSLSYSSPTETSKFQGSVAQACPKQALHDTSIRKPRSAPFLDLTRTMFNLSPLAEGPSPLAEIHSPLAKNESPLAENVSAPHSETCLLRAKLNFSLAESE